MHLTPFHGPPAAAPRVPGFTARTLLGFGTHGEVWLADDLTTGGTVALKIGRRVPDDPVAASGDPPGPEQESALLSQIDHPHIVRLQGVVPLPGGGLAMVLDLASGGSLASLIAARGCFEPGEVSTLLIPLADALDHLHRRGVVHGDIAPGNVLFAADGRPLLGDLGVARILGPRIGDAWATPGFIDPALTRSDNDAIDLCAADLWGLAAIGWFALTGRPPVPSAVPEPALERAPLLGALLLQCLSEAPEDRPSLSELAERAWQAVQPVPIRLAGSSERPSEGVGLPPVPERVTGRIALPDNNSGISNETPERLPGEPGPRESGRFRSDRRSGSDDAEAVPGKTPARIGFGAAVSRGSRGGVLPIRGGPGVAGLRRIGRSSSAGRRRAGAVALLVLAATVAAIGAVVASGSWPPAPSGPGSPGGPDAAPLEAGSSPEGDSSPEAGSSSEGGGPSATGGPGPAVPAGLEAELTRALAAIGRSRAVAFGRASVQYLTGADLAGSPAYQQDFELVQRLRARGYRLQGVRFEVSKVQVVHQRGVLVDVRAEVTTSEHRQVQVKSGTGVRVPADGPRAVLLTVAPVDLNLSGPQRWRVRSVQEVS